MVNRSPTVAEKLSRLERELVRQPLILRLLLNGSHCSAFILAEVRALAGSAEPQFLELDAPLLFHPTLNFRVGWHVPEYSKGVMEYDSPRYFCGAKGDTAEVYY